MVALLFGSALLAVPAGAAVPSPAADPVVRPAARAAVPPATGNDAVITVAVGGERPTQTEVGPLEGVQLQLYGGTSVPDANPLGDPWATCTSDAAGDCSFVVPDTQVGGANRDRRFWIKQSAAPAGWFANPALVTGPTNDLRLSDYQFRTGTQLRAGSTYRSSGPGAGFMQSSGNTNRQASGGIWQTSRDNPVLPPQCGLNVALIIDVSGSVGTAMPDLKKAAQTLTNSLVGTPSQLALFTFASNAPANNGNNRNRPLTPVSTKAGADQVNGWIDGLSSGGGTNWDRGFFQVAQDPADFDVAIVITDGNPTYYGNQEGPGNFTRFHEVEDGIFSANAVKAKGSRMIAVGVGDGVAGNPANLVAISGSNANDDYYQTEDYAQAGDALKALAQGNCKGSVTVVKQVVPSTSAPGSIDGATPAGGWTIGATATDGVTVDPTSGQTQDGTGALNFDLTFPGGVNSTALTVTETRQPGYSLVPVGGRNASCSDLVTATPVEVDNVVDGFIVPGASDRAISCVVHNRAPDPVASVVVDKKWVINGETFANGDQPEYLVAGLKIDGTGQPWGDAREDLVATTSVPITEEIDTGDGVSGLRQCHLDKASVTEANGETVDEEVLAPLAYQPILQEGLNAYTVTNVLTCQTKLTLNKAVLFGPADPASWTLTALAALPPVVPDPPGEPGPPGEPAPPVDALPGPSGPTGVTGTVTPDVRYPLAESGGNADYAQLTLPDVTLTPGSTGSWICVELDKDGTTVVSGYLDGLSGDVTVPFGTWVSCYAINATASLTMIKNVQNTHGGTAVPGDWNLTATPGDPNPSEVGPQTVPGSTDGATINVRPGQAYDLTESTVQGYELDSLECTVESQTRNAASLTLEPGDAAVCTFSNVDTPASLTLQKQVANGASGGTAVPANWTLSADGPTPISGVYGDDAIKDAPVNAGSYTLAEADGPGGYTAGTWSCTGAAVVGDTVEIPVGADVTCTITNTAVTPTLTLVKKVTNASGGSAVRTDWTLTAKVGDTVAISGKTGSEAVTDAPVGVGTYQLSESGPGGYAASDWSCTGATSFDATSVQVRLADRAICTVTNTDTPASLTLRKIVDPAESGSGRVPADWTVTAAPKNIPGQGTVSGNGDPTSGGGVNEVTVFAGDYDVSESGPPGFDAGNWVCQGGVLEGNSVQIPSGGNVICSITNTAVPPKLTLVKKLENGNTGGSAVATDWTLTADGPTPISGVTDSKPITAAPVQVGTYALKESGPPGYTASAWSCEGGAQDGASITLTEGQSATCSITNTADQPTLTLVKTVDNGSTGGGATPVDWTLTADGPTPLTGTSGQDPVTGVTVIGGDYTLNEQPGPAGYAASDWSCLGGTLEGAVVTVSGAGVHVVCTITNRAIAPLLTLVKVVDNGSTGATAGPSNWTLSAAGPATVSGTTGTPPITGKAVPVGDYALTETGPSGYSAGDWVCDGRTLTGATISLGLGQKATCTVTNTAVPGTWLLDKSSDPPSGEIVPAGTTITYRLTARHAAGVAVRNAVVTDDLSQVLSYATLEDPLAAGLTLSGTKLTWTVPEIPVGGSVETTYTATVFPDLDGVVIVNGADPATPGGSCGTCKVEHKVGVPVPPKPPVPPNPPTPPGPQPPTPTPLPDTGVPVGEYLAWAFGLMTVGALVLVAARRRRHGRPGG